MSYIRSFFQNHSFFSDKPTEETHRLAKDSSLKNKLACKNRDKVIAETIKPKLHTLSIQAKNVSHGVLIAPEEVSVTHAEIQAHSLLAAADKEKLKTEFHAALKSYPARGEKAHLHAQLKTVANFIGGGLITGGNKDKQLDGFLPEANFDIWQWLLTSADRHVDAKEAAILAKIKEGMTQLQKNAHFLNDLCDLPLSPQETTERIYAASLEHAQKIQRLRPGESEKFSGGWTNSGGAGGHAQIYEIERRKDGLLNVHVYTSTGFELTEWFLAGNKLRVKPLIRYEKVPDTVLFFGEKDQISPVFIQGLLEVKVLARKNPDLEVGEKHILGVLDHVEAYRVPVPIAEAGAISGQRGGTCVPSMTKQFIRYHAGSADLHKKLIFHSELKLLVAFYCSVENVLGKRHPNADMSRRALIQSARKLLRTSLKLKEKNLITPQVFEQTRATTLDIINKINAFEATLLTTRKAKVHNSDWQKASPEAQRLARKNCTLKVMVPPANAIAQPFSLPDLSIRVDLVKNCGHSLLNAIAITLQKRAVFDAYFGQFSEKANRNLSIQISHLIDQLPLPGTPEATNYWSQFSLEELQKAQKGLFDIAQLYSKRMGIQDLLERRFATLMPLQVIIHSLAVHIDTKISAKRTSPPAANFSNYGIPSFANALNLDGLLFFDRLQFSRLTQAADYIKSHNANAFQGVLFTSEIRSEQVERKKIVYDENKELLNGHYWNALVEADSDLKAAVTKKANREWPDLTEDEIRARYAEMADTYKRWKLHWGSEPENLRPTEPPKPRPLLNLPTQTKQTLILDSVGKDESSDFLFLHGYGHLTYFRKMNALANEGMYYGTMSGQLIARNGSAERGNPSSAHLSQLSYTAKELSESLRKEALNRGREINNAHKIFLQANLCKRDMSGWEQPIAEGKALDVGKKNTFLDKLLRPLSQWEISPEQLIYELDKEWTACKDKDLLDDPSFQALFCRLFFRSPVTKTKCIEFGFGDLIVKNPALREALAAFITKGLTRIQSQEMSFNSARFFFELSFHSAKYLADAGLHAEAEPFNQLSTIKKYFNEFPKLTPENRSTLHLYQVLFYSTQKGLTLQERASLFASWAIHQTFPKIDSKYKSPAIYTIAYDFIFRQIEQISHLPCQELGALIAAKIKILPEIKNAQWDVDKGLGFPYLSDGSSKINLLSGEMYRPEGPILGVPKEFRWESDKDFKRLFKDTSNLHYEALGEQCIGFTHPTKGAFRLIANHPNYIIQRRMEGHWYQYWPLGNPIEVDELECINPFPSALVFDHAYWVPVNQNPQVKGIFTNLKDLEPLYQANADGTIVELKADGLTLDYLSGEKADLIGFTKFGRLVDTLTYKKGDSLQKVVLPAYTSLDGNALAFDCKEQRLLWTENRDYEIGSAMKRGVLGTFENYLYLQSTQDAKRGKLLVPLQPIVDADTPATTCQLKKPEYPLKKSPNDNEFTSTQHFLTFDCVHGVIKATTLESRCYLAYIYFAQKKYEEATALLRGIKASEEVSKTAETILNFIQSLPEGEDHADGKMVRLHALSICLKNAKKKALEPIYNFLVHSNNELLERHILSWSEVLQHSTSVSAACRLSEKDEIHLLERLQVEGKQLLIFKRFIGEKCAFLPANLKQLKARQQSLQKKKVKPLMERLSNGQRDLELKASLSTNIFVSSYAKNLVKAYHAAKHGNLKQDEIRRTVNWLKEGLNQDEVENKIHSTLKSDATHKDRGLFLEVYTIAKGASSAAREEMLYRLLMWKKFAEKESNTEFLDVLILLTKFPKKFPALVRKDATDSDLFNFLVAVDSAYAWCDKELTQNYSRRLDSHDLGVKTHYAIPIGQTFEVRLRPLSNISANKIPLKVVYEAQVSRWQQFKNWKNLLGEDLAPRVLNQNDFQFNSQDVLNANDANYRASLIRDFELSTEDYQKGKEQNLASKPKKLSSQNCAILKNQAQEALVTLAAKRKNLEIQLLAKANQRTATELTKLAGKVSTWIHFQDCVDCLLSFDARCYIQKNENLTTADIHEMAQMTLQILDLKSHEAQLGRVIGLSAEIQACADQVENVATYRSLCQQMETELSNQYHFEQGFSDEEQAVMRIFAGQGGIIPFKKQVELIQKMLTEDPENKANFQDIVIQLIMGGGKTSVIATLMLILASKRKGRLAFFIVPAALHQIVTANLGEGLQKAFGKELLSIDMEREAFTEFKLQQTFELLEQAEQNQQPIIVSATTLQGFELELLSVSRELKKIINERAFESNQTPPALEKIQALDAAIKVLQPKATLLNKILRITETKADSLIDEVDLILNSLQELNFVDGEKMAIHTIRNGLLLSIYKSLLSKNLIVETLPGKPSVDDVIRLTQLQRPHQDPKEYLLHVVPVLAKNLANTYKPFVKMLSGAQRDAFVRYASGKIPAALEKYVEADALLTEADIQKEFPGCSFDELKNDLEFLQHLYHLKSSDWQEEKELADLIAISKHFLTELTPACLPKEGERDFGNDPKHPGKIIPYVGILAPASTEFGYHWENVAYHYQFGAAFKPSKEMIFSLASMWITTAKHYVVENGEKFEETAEYISFLKLFGVKLDEIHEEGVVEKAIDTLFQDREKCLDLQFELAGRFAGYASERLTSNGLALCDLLASRLSMSGTPWNAEGYDRRLAQRIIRDVGTEGRILHKLAERASPDKVIEVDQPATIQEFLQQVYARYATQNRPFSKVRGIIEAGGIFKGFGNNSTIAKGWMDFIAQKQTEEEGSPVKTVDPAIEAVLFFGADPGQMQQNTLYVWKKGSTQPERIGGTTLEALNAKGLDPSKYVVFIDEVHGTGTDIPQKVDALNIVTFDDMTTRKATQNIMRCRKFLSEQDVDFVLNKETRIALHHQGKSVQDLFVNAAKKQSITKTESMVRYFSQQIHHIFRKHAIQLVRSAIDKNLMDDKDFATCVENAEKFFVSYMDELPFEQHGKLMNEVDTKAMLLEILERKHHLFKTKINIPAVLVNVEKDVQGLTTWIQESKVLPGKWKNLDNALGIEQEVEQQIQIQAHVETEVEIEVEIENELKQYLQGRPLIFHEEPEMTLKVFQSLLDEMKKPEKSAQVTSLQKQLGNYAYKFDGKRFHYENCFAEPIFGTSAYFHTCKTSAGLKNVFPIFHPTQRPPKQILAVRHEGQIRWLLLSEHEARDAAGHLETLYQNKRQAPEAWLIQPDGTLFVKGPEPFPLRDVPAVNGLIELNALAGHVSYLNARQNRQNFSTWLETEAELKARFLKLRSLHDEVQKQHLISCEPIAALSKDKKIKKQNGVEKFMCKLRQKREKSSKGTLLLAEPGQVKMLPQASVGELKVSQVPLLGIDPKSKDPVTLEALKKLAVEQNLTLPKEIAAAARAHTKKQFSAVQAFQVPYLTPEQLRWLPKNKVRFISFQQIGQLTPQVMAKMPHVIKALTTEQLQRIHPNLAHLIPEERCKDLSLRQLNHFGLAEYNQLADAHPLWERITPDIISFLPKDKVKNIAKEQYCHISVDNKDALDSVSKFDFVHLNKAQLAKRKSSFALYFLGVMTLGVAVCIVSAIAYLTFPLVWVANRENARRYNRALALNFKRVGHLFNTYVPALFTK